MKTFYDMKPRERSDRDKGIALVMFVVVFIVFMFLKLK